MRSPAVFGNVIPNTRGRRCTWLLCGDAGKPFTDLILSARDAEHVYARRGLGPALQIDQP